MDKDYGGHINILNIYGYNILDNSLLDIEIMKESLVLILEIN
jgi:hypothetical protein